MVFAPEPFMNTIIARKRWYYWV